MNLFLTKNFLGNTSKTLSTEGYKISIVSYTQKVSEDWHWHDKVHLSSIIQGGNLESRKSHDIQVTPNKVMIYNQGEVHRNRFTAHPSKNLNIEFENQFFQGDIQLNQLTVGEPTNLAFHRIFFELSLNDCFSEQSIDQRVKALFWNDLYQAGGDWLPKLKELLNDRWSEFPSLAELSQELQVHPITISKYFTKYTGMTLSEYLRKLKTMHAVGLLMNSTKSLAEVAFTCGFSDQSHMNRLLKLYVGHSPGTIRSLR